MRSHTHHNPPPCGLSPNLEDLTVAVMLTLFGLAFVYLYRMIVST